MILASAHPATSSDRRIAAEVQAARDRLGPDAVLGLWVELEDKGLAPESARAALQAIEAGWTEPVRRRRLRAGAAAAQLDLPVQPRYVDRLRREGARIRYASRWLNAVSLDAEAHRLERLAAGPEVSAVRLRARYRLPEVEVDSAPPPPAGARVPRGAGLDYGPAAGQIRQIQAHRLHRKGLSGRGVIVCMIDTGFRRDHEALRSPTVLAERDFIFGDRETANQPGDAPSQWEHGTGTWSVLGGFAPGRLIGPAYGSTFLLAKTEDIRSETRIEEDYFVAAAEWADQRGADVISASLGYLGFDDGFSYTPGQLDGASAVTSRAVNAAAEVGITVCVAVGNQGPQSASLITPADAFEILAVGAISPNRQIAVFSSRGPTADGRIKPEVVAQGIATYWADADDPEGYALASGTSLATPLVGGGAALLLEAHPDWGPRQVREALLQTASRHAAPDNSYGYGLIQLKKAERYRFR